MHDTSGKNVISEMRGAIDDTSGTLALQSVTTPVRTSGDVTVERAASLNIRSKESGAVKAKDVRGKIQVSQTVSLKRE